MTDAEQAKQFWTDLMRGDFYFEAQTGIIRDQPPAVSNFYQYRLPGWVRGLVESAVESAEVGPGGLNYTAPGFLARLKEWEEIARR